MKLNCIIIDDEPVARKVLEEYIEDIDFMELAGKAEDPVKASTILNNTTIDLMFLDINMPRLSGIEFLRTSRSLPMTIMTTAYAEYAIEGFELDVLDYLVKPISFERFLKACHKAKDYYELQKNSRENQPGGQYNDYFFVKCDGKIEKVLYEELIYIEAMLNYIVLHTTTRKMMVYLTIKGITEKLPPTIFLKIHKSYIININKIKSINGNEIDLGHAKVVISQNLYEETMRGILKDKMIKR
ncbi:MAG: LytTR family DNA-binding domain-containing protein [Bacteroidota bacterium]|nr:LytTR family DNA-binding domain-containing protein [Bacteroidota bacterium]